jgi:hypothetical protein
LTCNQVQESIHAHLVGDRTSQTRLASSSSPALNVYVLTLPIMPHNPCCWTLNALSFVYGLQEWNVTINSASENLEATTTSSCGHQSLIALQALQHSPWALVVDRLKCWV